MSTCTLFELDGGHERTQCVYVNPEHLKEHQEIYEDTSTVVMLSAGTRHVAFPVVPHEEVTVGDVVSSTACVPDLLGIKNGSPVNLTICAPSSIREVAEIEDVQLTFVQRCDFRRWDEIASGDTGHFPGAWLTRWPHGVSTTVVQKMAPNVLQGKWLAHEGLVAVKILDGLMVFRVHFQLSNIGLLAAAKNEPTEHPNRKYILIKAQPTLKYTILCDDQVNEEKDQEYKQLEVAKQSREDSERFSSFRNVRNFRFQSYVAERIEEYVNIIRINIGDGCHGRTDEEKTHLLGIQSLLISGGIGAGKTFLFEQLRDQGGAIFSAGGRGTLHNIEIIQLSCRPQLSSNSSVASLSAIAESIINTAPSTANECDQLVECVEQLKLLLTGQSSYGGKSDASAASVAIGERPVKILLLDDLDDIFMFYKQSLDSEAGNSGSTAGGCPDLIGLVLSKILSLLSQRSSSSSAGSRNGARSSSGSQYFVIGATRLTATELPSSATGCPQFDKIVSLPRPSVTDRQNLALAMFQSVGVIPQTASVTRSAESNNYNPEQSTLTTLASDWAAAVARITAGYLPGDIRSVIKRAVLLFRGRGGGRDKSKGNETEIALASGINDGAVVKSVLDWSALKQAVAETQPQQLQAMDIYSSSTSSASQTGMSSCHISNSKLCWDDFAGYEDVKLKLKRIIAPPGGLTQFTSMNHCSISGSALPVSLPPAAAAAAAATTAAAQLFPWKPPRGIVLHGPSGCGKTFLANIIAAEANMNVVAVRSTELLSKYFGQTESKIRDLFRRARSAAPCLLFFDEFDSLAFRRDMTEGGNDGGVSSSGLQGRILSTFLTELDGVSGAGAGAATNTSRTAHLHEADSIANKYTAERDSAIESRVLVVVACGSIESVDEALLRPGRLQQHILVDHPSAGDIAAIIRRQATRHMPCEVVEKEPATEINRSNNSSACSSHCNESSKEEDATVNVTALAAQLIAAKASALPTCADVEHFCNRARRRALLEYIELSQGHQNSNDAVGEMPKKRVTQKHFQAVLAEMTK